MPSTADAADPNERGLFALIGHYAMPLYIAFLVENAVAILFDFPDWHDGVSWALVIATLYVWVAGFKHRRRFCSRCVAAWPLDGDVQAEKRMRVLRTWHRMVAAPLLPLGMYFTPLVAGALISVLNGPGLLSRICGFLGQAALISILYAHMVHDKLLAWCPWCRRRGDDNASTPTPDPVLRPDPHTV